MDPDLGRDLCRAHKAAIEEEEGSGQNLLMGHLRIVNITIYLVERYCIWQFTTLRNSYPKVVFLNYKCIAHTHYSLHNS